MHTSYLNKWETETEEQKFKAVEASKVLSKKKERWENGRGVRTEEEAGVRRREWFVNPLTKDSGIQHESFYKWELIFIPFDLKGEYERRWVHMYSLGKGIYTETRKTQKVCSQTMAWWESQVIQLGLASRRKQIPWVKKELEFSWRVLIK